MTESFVFKLIDKFDGSSLVSLDYSNGDTHISLKKQDLSVCQTVPSANAMPGASAIATSAGVGDAGAPTGSAQKDSAQGVVSGAGGNTSGATSGTAGAPLNVSDEVADGTEFVESPIVGTFYRSPSPDSPAYAEKGSKIKKGAPLCIIEAMKMMNTLTAEFDMEVVDILAENGALAEYGQPLFAVKRL